jgi:hypothetical protein
MREVVCSYCGAVFFARADDAVCPHCGRNPRKMAWKAVWTSEKLWIVLWMVWVFVLLRPSRNDWGQDAVVFALATGVVVSQAFFGKQNKFIALDLNRREISQDSLEPTPPQEPRVPEMWAGLISSPRPRDVFWPTGSLIWVIVDGLFAAGTIVFAGEWVHRHGSSWHEWQRAWEHISVFLVVTAVTEAAMLLGLYREIRNGEFLRDGEATVGTIVDMSERRSPAASYQFWTRTGERFQHVGLVMSKKDEWSAPGLVPVFYFPENPSRSLALFSTRLRVRTPSDDFSRRDKRIGFSS